MPSAMDCHWNAVTYAAMCRRHNTTSAQSSMALDAVMVICEKTGSITLIS